MACPSCKKNTRQDWDNGYPQTPETPEEYAGYECGWCGTTYSDETDPVANAADYENDAKWINEHE